MDDEGLPGDRHAPAHAEHAGSPAVPAQTPAQPDGVPSDSQSGYAGVLAAAHGPAVERLVTAIQELSLARELPAVMAVVRRTARELCGADGATFVLRDRNLCFYADEDAIAPLWKGLRFPMSACISGWAMLNRRSVIVEDIYADARVPVDAYRPTFVKSLAMVPIRQAEPVGAIGVYWAARRRPTREEMALLQTLADSTSIAIESVQLYGELERRVRERTAQLEDANRELEAFSYSVSHDLRGPLQAISGYSELVLARSAARLDPPGRENLEYVVDASHRMSRLIDDLLRLSQVARATIRRERVDLSAVAQCAADDLRRAQPDRAVEFTIAPGLDADGDPGLLRVVLDNLFSNAWKFTRDAAAPRIEFAASDARSPRARDATSAADAGAADAERPGARSFVVRDNGAGFDMDHAARLFGAFERLPGSTEFAGTGIGLATVRRIVERHGGRIWAESRPGAGAAFHFTIP